MNKAFGDLLRVVSQRNNLKKKKKKRLSFPIRLVISVALCQYTLTFLSLKKDIKKRIPPRIYRYHPPCNELMISGMVLKHL